MLAEELTHAEIIASTAFPHRETCRQWLASIGLRHPKLCVPFAALALRCGGPAQSSRQRVGSLQSLDDDEEKKLKKLGNPDPWI